MNRARHGIVAQFHRVELRRADVERRPPSGFAFQQRPEIEDGNIAPFYGNIAPFYGNIAPFYGNIAPFYGNIAPFYGNIAPFWGNLSPFYGNIAPFWGSGAPALGASSAGSTTPGWSTVAPFWQSLGSSWTSLDSAWAAAGSYDADPTKYAALSGQLNGFVDQSAAFWGAAVTAKTGKSFRDGYAASVFAKYGIDPNDPSSLAKMSQPARASFMLDWYDGLMEYSGVDHVDHWMKTINWTPSITQIQGEGKHSIIGLLDFAVGDPAIRQNIVSYNGISNFTNGHGAAVASLMVAAHDGKGVMGIAPMASVVAYNPFDETGTANWRDITRGVALLAGSGSGNASIVNMSLGVPGMTLDGGWKAVFSDPSVVPTLKNTVFVTAAGNDGKAQTQNIPWNFAADPALIVVGSVDPTGAISAFSNTPGTACLLKSDGKCDPKNLLMNRSIVAPGELILVSDDQGGVTRQSGTSFAAPLVSGTIALIHNRWPWLANYPKETVQIILQSARDLGTPGVDSVYGVGLLDVTAANSPLNFDKLKWYNLVNGALQSTDAGKITDPKNQAKWEANGVFFYAFEDIGATKRDFAIPLSSKLLGGSVVGPDGVLEQFQSYITSRMTDWLRTKYSGGVSGGFSNFTDAAAAVRNPYGLNLTMSIAPRNPSRPFLKGDLPFQTSFRASTPENNVALRFGFGDGALALGTQPGFGLFSDYDVNTGGANPLLGMASGGGYAGMELALNSRLTVSTGFSGNDSRRDLADLSFPDRVTRATIDKYKTGAQHITLSYQLDDRIMVTGSLTHLTEAAGLLGLQSLDPNDFRAGANTDGVTLGGQIRLSRTLRLSGSATVWRTRRGDASRHNIAVGSGGLITSAYEVALSADRLFGRSDRLRVTLSQPMHLESGSIDVTTVQVINRQTGELGPVTQSFALGAPSRQYVAEVLYGRLLPDNLGEMSLFGRANLRPTVAGEQGANYIAGGRYSLDF